MGHNPILESEKLHSDSMKTEYGNVSHQKQADIGGNNEHGKCFHWGHVSPVSHFNIIPFTSNVAQY